MVGCGSGGGSQAHWILSVERGQLPVDIGPGIGQNRRIFKEDLTDDREELGRIFQRIRVQRQRLARRLAGAQVVPGPGEGLLPDGGVHAAMQGRAAVGAIRQHVQLVRHLMNDDVVTWFPACVPHILPGEDDRPLQPGLATQGVAVGVDHASLVLVFPVRYELGGIENHGAPSPIPVQTQIENGQGGYGRHAQLHGVINDQTASGFQPLAQQETQTQCSKPVPVGRREALDGWPVRNGGLPLRLGDGQSTQFPVFPPVSESLEYHRWSAVSCVSPVQNALTGRTTIQAERMFCLSHTVEGGVMDTEELDTEEIKQYVKSRQTWLRLLYMVIFVFFAWVASFVFGVVVLVLFLWQLFAGKTNDQLRSFGQSLSHWGYQVMTFLTFNSEDLPFPFDTWPSGPAKGGSSSGGSRSRKKASKKKKKTASSTSSTSSSSDSTGTQ